MSDRFSVITQDLAAHAGAVDAVGDGVQEAGGAGRSVRAGGDAYGKICNFLPPLMAVLQETLIQGIADSADDLRDTARKLRATAEHYNSTDARNADAITRSGRLP
ncbi:type VII secretion target [Paractinoplanes atraurantiacus]|uniref:Excreted virulence factor EspC, type VII ESX diderm n=1 Tax=Paractinoplanes atraurantiacus TaxID=1036182 RepID=A0A285KQB2_9ACTN|nr:type VII secretion target [Actinoplanes atraurantiacus]SNY74057.1 Excreted virulence factor EspC, type VII ESX diderm [Actinoplanes atraurantiacus]